MEGDQGWTGIKEGAKTTVSTCHWYHLHPTVTTAAVID